MSSALADHAFTRPQNTASVPVVAVGGVLAVTGSALTEVGESAMNTGSELSRVGHQPATTVNIIVTPDAAPTLD